MCEYMLFGERTTSSSCRRMVEVGMSRSGRTRDIELIDVAVDDLDGTVRLRERRESAVIEITQRWRHTDGGWKMLAGG